jgi:hypothetical protein
MASVGEQVRSDDVQWKVVSALTGVVGAVITRRVLQALWPKVISSGHEPPLNPADRRIGWSEAVTWAVAAGVGASIGRLVSQRFAAAGWEVAKGSPPPGIVTDH